MIVWCENPLEKAGKENSEDDIYMMAGKNSNERRKNNFSLKFLYPPPL